MTVVTRFAPSPTGRLHAAIISTALPTAAFALQPAVMSDSAIRRADGSSLYLLPRVIDDLDLGITHIVRGDAHVSNSAVQRQMFDALGAAHPLFAHEALLVAAEGKLSKRLAST